MGGGTPEVREQIVVQNRLVFAVLFRSRSSVGL